MQGCNGKLPERVLYRGHFKSAQDGLLLPCDGRTCVGESGCFVFASSDRVHAAAYGFKEHKPSSIGVFKITNTRRNAKEEPVGTMHFYVPYAWLGAEEGAEMFFRRIQNDTVYLQTLSASGFRAIFPSDPKKMGAEPLEWASNHAVGVCREEKRTKGDLLRLGVQLFVSPVHVVHNHMEKGTPLDPHTFAALIRQDDMVWENARPIYDGDKRARPDALSHLLRV